jgi:hypothetical protein
MSNFPNKPFGDITKMLEQFKVPGIDMNALIEFGKKRKPSLLLFSTNESLRL